MNQNLFRRLEIVASFALVGCVSVGALLCLVPIIAPFDPRWIGVALGAMYGAVDQFGREPAG